MISYDFGKRDKPCGDCWDGHCTMNCGPAAPSHEAALRTFYAEPTLDNARTAIHELRKALADAKGRPA